MRGQKQSKQTEQLISRYRATKQARLKREMKRLYHAIRTGRFDVEVGWFRDPYRSGMLTPDRDRGGGRIRVNPLWDMVSVFVHELYHHLEPRASEKRVLELERFIAYTTSLGQQQRLLRHFQRLWFATIAQKRNRGKYVAPCPLCGQKIPDSKP